MEAHSISVHGPGVSHFVSCLPSVFPPAHGAAKPHNSPLSFWDHSHRPAYPHDKLFGLHSSERSCGARLPPLFSWLPWSFWFSAPLPLRQSPPRHLCFLFLAGRTMSFSGSANTSAGDL